MNITKFDSKTTDFITNMSLNAEGKSKISSIALARVIASDLTLPSSEVSNIFEFYNTNEHLMVVDKILNINEIIIINRDEVLDYVYRFYKYRYINAIGTIPTISSTSTDIVCNFFNIGKSFDKNVIDCIREDPYKLQVTTNGFIALLEQLTEGEE